MVANQTDGLTPQQEAAILALLAEPTVAKAAETSGVPERTMHRWLREPVFRAAYQEARRDAFQQALSMVHRYAPAAVATLVKAMHDNSAPWNSRVTAATAMLKFSREALELDDLAERVKALEITSKENEPWRSR